MAKVRIRLAVDADLPALSLLMIEMQRHYGAAHPDADTLEAQLAALPVGVEILVAEEAVGGLVGLAAFTSVYPGPGLTGGLFLKDVYVTGQGRGAGVGQLFMAALAGLAKSRGLKRVDWTVSASNLAARRFYDRLGAAPDPDRIFYRLQGEAFEKLAEKSG